MGSCKESGREGRSGGRFGLGRGKSGFFERMPRIPLFLLGFGLHRAWIEIAFVGSFVDFPAARFGGHDLFDSAMLVTALVFVAFSKRIGTLFDRKALHVFCGLALTCSTMGLFASLAVPACASALAVPSAVLGGVGIALMILFWCELYCCLNPVRVGLCFCASIVVGALVVYVCRGFLHPWLFAAMLMLPIASLLCLRAGFRSLSESELPCPVFGGCSFPWKPVLLMALFAFAFGLKEPSLYAGSFGLHSAFGTLVIALVVFAGIVSQGSRFDFRTVHRFALPLMVATFLVLPSLGFLDSAAADFCMTGSYTAFSILIMTILANLSYRYGVSAIWLFGIERVVRTLFNLLGRETGSVFARFDLVAGLPSDFALNALVILLVAILTMMLFSEREPSGRWGVVVLDEAAGDAGEGGFAVKSQQLVELCGKVAKERGLSRREEEVLLLLAQRKSIGDIEEELVIAKGTAKTHIRNVYRKLGVHSRDELVELLETF